MMKKIVIIALCLCLLTACSGSSSTAGESSNTESSTTSDTATTTENTTISTTTSFAEKTTAAKPADVELWKDTFFFNLSEISIPIPNGYTADNDSTMTKRTYTNSAGGLFSISSIDNKPITDDYISSISEKMKSNTEIDVHKYEIRNVKGHDVGLIWYKMNYEFVDVIIQGNQSGVRICLADNLAADNSLSDMLSYLEFSSFNNSSATTTTSQTTTTTTKEPEATTTTSTSTQGVSIEYKNALREALSYLRSSSFSKEGLIKQLEYEKYSRPAAEYAVNNCGANWNEQALKEAQAYLRSSGFSKKGLIKQLEYEKFTSSESAYGVANCGADWNEQAVKVAQAYLKSSSFSKQELIKQLIYEGFTQAQAQHGADVAYK